MDWYDYELLSTILLVAAALLWVLSIILWFGLRIPEDLAEIWEIMRD